MKELIQQYIDWLKERYTLEKIGEWYEITTPFLDPHNDYIQIYAKAEDERILISDGGDTLKDLEFNGVYIDRSEKRKSELYILLNSAGIKRKENELFVYATRNNFAEVKHRIIQTILSVYDLFILAEPKVESFFIEDISGFFDEKDIRYIKTLSFLGKSGFNHQFDFSIPKTKRSPERIIKAVNSPRKDVISSLLFSFEDTKSIRSESKGLILLNDAVSSISPDIFQAIKEYGLEAIPWSKKEKYLDILSN